MINDLDSEMMKRGIQAIVVHGYTTLGDADLSYVVGGALARGGTYIKKIGHPPLLVTSNLDIGTARKCGRVKHIQTYTDWGLEKLSRKYGRGKAFPHMLAMIMKKERIRGKVELCGRNDLASGVFMADQLRRLGVKVVGERPPTVLDSARETKSSTEIEELRRVGRKTTKIVSAISDMLRNLKRKRAALYLGGQRATIGLLKSKISSAIVAEGLVAPEGTIFAIGSSGADPHNSGMPSSPIREGKLIVFDIFPQAESGYWSDVTRTFMVGRADAKAKRLYNAVLDAQTSSLDYIRPGVTGEEAMVKACDIVERYGYHTIREVFEGKSTSLLSGFNHSLGHGVGLTIGEGPYLSFLSEARLKAGQVVTVEPGVYLPGYGGVRIEDTVAITSRGIENLSPLKKELELT
jgi:Xaa-Pro aminopeptidase